MPNDKHSFDSESHSIDSISNLYITSDHDLADFDNELNWMILTLTRVTLSDLYYLL